MKFLMRTDLKSILDARKGANIISIGTETVPKTLKKGNPYTNLKKFSLVNGFVNFNYQKGVNKRRGKELKATDFVAEKPWWDSADNSPVVKHPETGEEYLRIAISKITAEYTNDGEQVSLESVKPYLANKDKPYGKQDVKNPVKVVAYKLSNIKSISIDGNQYYLV